MPAAHLGIGNVTKDTCACSTFGMQHIALLKYHCQMHSLDGDNRMEYCLVCIVSFILRSWIFGLLPRKSRLHTFHCQKFTSFIVTSWRVIFFGLFYCHQFTSFTATSWRVIFFGIEQCPPSAPWWEMGGRDRRGRPGGGRGRAEGGRGGRGRMPVVCGYGTACVLKQ